MSVLHLYQDATAGNDANTGDTSWASAVKTNNRMAEILTDVYNNYDFDNQYTSIQVNKRNILSIPSGGSLSDVICAPASVFSDIVWSWADDTYDILGTHFAISATGYKTRTLVVPAGCTIEAVACDLFMHDPSHYNEQGFRKIYLKPAADAGSVGVGDWFHDGGSTLHTNEPFGVGGYLVVRYRPSAEVRMYEFGGRGITFRGPTSKRAGIVHSMYVAVGYAPYAIFLSMNASFHDNYRVERLQFWGAWHDIGVLDTSPTGVLEVSEIHTPDCVFHCEVISDKEGTSFNPIVVYSGNTTGTEGSPITLEITNWTYDRYICYAERPLYWDGTPMPGGTGGLPGNNNGQIIHAHGGDEHCRVHVFNPATNGRATTGPQVIIGAYTVIDPFFAQRDTQTRTDTPHSDASWQAWAEDAVFTAKRPYNAGDANTGFGMCQFSPGTMPRLRRLNWTLPDASVSQGSGSAVGWTLSSFGGLPVVGELEDSIITVKGNQAGTVRNIFNLGSATSADVTLRTRNCEIVNEASSLAADLVVFHGTGATLAATLAHRRTTFHSLAPTGFKLMSGFTSTSLPLNSADPTRNVFEDCAYSRIEIYDTVTASRSSAANWQTGTEGPHDSLFSQASGVRDAQYGVVGIWDSINRQFGKKDAARIPIKASVTLVYTPTIGLNRVPFKRQRTAKQFAPAGFAFPRADDGRGIRERGRGS